MFAAPNNQKCPVKAYKVYAESDPWKWKPTMHRFTLAVNNVKSGNNDVLPTDIMQLSGHKNVQSITRYSTVSQKQQLNMKSHSHRNEFGRNSSPVWLFYCGEKKARVWRTHLSNISSNLFSVKQGSSTAAPFSFLGCCYKRRTYRCGNKHFKSIAHTFSVRGKP